MKKLWILLLTIAMMVVLWVPALATGGLVPVVAQVPEDWTCAYLYAWKDVGVTFAATIEWPGIPMTEVEKHIFCTYMTPDMENVIIHDGNGTQTPDLTVIPDQPVFVSAAIIDDATVKYELPIAVPSAEELESIPPVFSDLLLSGRELYVAGDFNEWNPCAEGYRMNDEGDGSYTLVMDIKAGNHSLKITDGTWDNCNSDDDPVDFNTDDGQLTVVFDGDLSDVKLSGANVQLGHKPKAEIPVWDDWYVAGDFNEWNPCAEGYKMNDEGDGSYTLVMDIKAGNHTLRITDGTWDVYSDDGIVDFNTDDGQLTVVFDGDISDVKLSGADVQLGHKPKAEIPVGDDWYVTGDFNNWEPCDPAYKMEDDGDGTYSLKFPLKAGTYHLRVNSGIWQENLGNTVEDYCLTVPVDGDVTVHFDGTTITSDPGEEGHLEEPEKKQEETPSVIFWIVVGGVVIAVAIVMIILVVRKKNTALKGG